MSFKKRKRNLNNNHATNSILQSVLPEKCAGSRVVQNSWELPTNASLVYVEAHTTKRGSHYPTLLGWLGTKEWVGQRCRAEPIMTGKKKNRNKETKSETILSDMLLYSQINTQFSHHQRGYLQQQTGIDIMQRESKLTTYIRSLTPEIG